MVQKRITDYTLEELEQVVATGSIGMTSGIEEEGWEYKTTLSKNEQSGRYELITIRYPFGTPPPDTSQVLLPYLVRGTRGRTLLEVLLRRSFFP